VAEDSLRMLATTDGLTGIHNRRTGIELGQKVLASAHRYNHPMAVILLDADNFKKVNDRFGHDAGDQVLVQLVKIMKSQLRKSDIMCRYGGEEFVILLPETSITKARVLATRVLEAVRNTSVKIKEDMEIYFTVSMGISDNTRQTDDLSVIINKADEAMYAAKSNGRDRLEIYSEDNVDTIMHRPVLPAPGNREQKIA
jgi:diguanylate cyclase (GGDEF)-like protein